MNAEHSSKRQKCVDKQPQQCVVNGAAPAHAALDAAIEESGWASVVRDATKQPTVVDTAEEFLECLFYGKVQFECSEMCVQPRQQLRTHNAPCFRARAQHMDDVVVLRDGLHKLRMHDYLPR